MPSHLTRLIRENMDRLMLVARDPITSRAELGRRAGMSQGAANNSLRDDKPWNPKLDTLEKLSVALGISVWQLCHPQTPANRQLNETVAGGLSEEALAIAALVDSMPPGARKEVLSFARWAASERGRVPDRLAAAVDAIKRDAAI